MDQCARCGHSLGVGRFCVNCGHPRGEAVPTEVPAESPDEPQVSTAERPAVADATRPPSESPWGPAPTAPPPVYGSPPKVRYPLYADEPAPGPSDSTQLAAQPPAWESAAATTHSHRARRGFLPWLLVAAALVLVAATGVFLLVGGSDDPGEATDPPPNAPGAGDGSSSAPSGTPSSPSESPSEEPEPGEPRDVARGASASVPVTAKPGRDVDGNAVRYDATNMLDGQPDTAWRMPGDGTGTVVSFDLAEPTRLSEVGLVNGYAKRDPGYDGYAANRRIIAVEWEFADGTVVEQTLGESRSVQTIDVDVVTETVEARIVAVTRPGRGPSGRDYTAISDVALVGAPL